MEKFGYFLFQHVVTLDLIPLELLESYMALSIDFSFVDFWATFYSNLLVTLLQIETERSPGSAATASTNVFHFPDSGQAVSAGSGSRAGSAERRMSNTSSPYSVSGQAFIDSPRRVEAQDSSRRSVCQIERN